MLCSYAINRSSENCLPVLRQWIIISLVLGTLLFIVFQSCKHEVKVVEFSTSVFLFLLYLVFDIFFFMDFRQHLMCIFVLELVC